MHRAPLELPVMALVIRRIEQERQRHLEDVLHLALVQLQLERRRHQADHGRDAKARARVVIRECAQHLHRGGRKADFLVRLTQRSCLRRRVERFRSAAGKAHLSGVRLEVGSPQREEHGQLFRPRHDRQEYRGRGQGGRLGSRLLIAVERRH
jgi:hypothetical protein